MITVKELSKIMNVRSGNIKNFINFGKKGEYFFTLIRINNQEKSRSGKTIIKCRPMWCIDESKIDEFIAYWNIRTKERRPKISNGKTGADRLAWTNMARECYEVKGICSKCTNNKTCAEVEKITHERKMKKTVIALVREIGLPPERINDD